MGSRLDKESFGAFSMMEDAKFNKKRVTRLGYEISTNELRANNVKTKFLAMTNNTRLTFLTREKWVELFKLDRKKGKNEKITGQIINRGMHKNKIKRLRTFQFSHKQLNTNTDNI